MSTIISIKSGPAFEKFLQKPFQAYHKISCSMNFNNNSSSNRKFCYYSWNTSNSSDNNDNNISNNTWCCTREGQSKRERQENILLGTFFGRLKLQSKKQILVELLSNFYIISRGQLVNTAYCLWPVSSVQINEVL